MHTVSLNMLGKLGISFAAGALGGLANSVIAWITGAVGITAALGVAIAPEMSPAWLYPRIVWGGLWGFTLLLPVAPAAPLVRGLILSLGPSLVMLLIVFPLKTTQGLFGLGFGNFTPFFVLLFNAAWGVTAAYALQAALSRD